MIGEKSLWAYCLGNFHEIEGYDRCIADKTNTKWVVHHRLELNDDGTTRYTAKELKERGLYYHRDPSELLILTNKEHGLLNRNSTTDETRRKIREKAIGRSVTEEARAKIGKANKGRKFTEEQKKNLREATKHIDRRAQWTEEKRMKLSEYKKAWWKNKREQSVIVEL